MAAAAEAYSITLASCFSLESALYSGSPFLAFSRHSLLTMLYGHAGEKQRVAFARAILKNPRILLLDEVRAACNVMMPTAAVP